MALPLEGYRILELTMWGAAPYGAGHLCDMGAEVIKIEEPVGGDRVRGIFSSGGLQSILYPHPINYPFELGNRGKKSVGIDVRKERGREAVLRLVAHCDAFITSLRKPSLKKYGLDYPSLSRHNPKLIYVHLGTFGAHGPDAHLPGQDLTGQARGGMLNLMRHNPEEEPLSMGVFSVGDFTASMQLSYATALALLHRERTGVGQEVNVSLLGAQIMAGEFLFQIYLTTGKEPLPVERTEVKNPIRNIYRCADGKWVALGMTEGDRYWQDFCQAIGHPELATDPRFDDIVKRAGHSRELIAILDQVMATRTRDEWCRILKQYECTAAPVQSYADLANDPQVIENKYVATVEHPTHGPIKEVGVTFELTRSPGRIGGPAPELGQHTEEVLTGLGGYAWEELEGLKKEGVII